MNSGPVSKRGIRDVPKLMVAVGILLSLILPGLLLVSCGPIPPPPKREGTIRKAPVEPVSPEPVETGEPEPAVEESAADPAAATRETDGVYHRVQAGQTLWRIARTYEVPLETLAQANRMDDPTLLETGQLLFVPGALRVLDVEVYTPPADEQNGVLSALTFTWPVSGTITSRFGGRRNHGGLDIAAPKGTEVRAAAAGKVLYSGSKLRGYGNVVIVDHGDDVVTLYAHNLRNSVRSGKKVRQGQVIARVGSTGHSTGPHLHFEVRVGDRRIDPLKYLSH